MTKASPNPVRQRPDAPRSRACGRIPNCFAALLCGFLLASACAATWGRPRTPVADWGPGERIYRDGMLLSGAPLLGERASAPGIQGKDAACTNCHRRSGLGEIEGRVLVPPVTARYLYRPRKRPGDTEGVAQTISEPGWRPELLPQAERGAYTDATLARAIREGIGPDGRRLDYLMPRFRLNEADMASLIAYLKQLSKSPSSRPTRTQPSGAARSMCWSSSSARETCFRAATARRYSAHTGLPPAADAGNCTFGNWPARPTRGRRSSPSGWIGSRCLR
jgi:hypothetical protein